MATAMQIGVLELVTVALSLAISGLLWLLGSRRWLWGVTGTLCLAAAAVLTPADLLSTLLMGVPLFVAFLVGTRLGSRFGRHGG